MPNKICFGTHLQCTVREICAGLHAMCCSKKDMQMQVMVPGQFQEGLRLVDLNLEYIES